MTAPNIIAGFSTCRVCPFSKNVIQLPESVFKPESLVKDTGLAYIPLYSPSRVCEDDGISYSVLPLSHDDTML